jgi:hypothetical protein
MKKMTLCGVATFSFCLPLLFGPLASSAKAEEMALTLLPSKDNYINRCSGSGTDINYGAATNLLVRSFDGCCTVETEDARPFVHSRFRVCTARVSGDPAAVLLPKAGISIRSEGRMKSRAVNDWTEGWEADGTQGRTTLGSSWEYRHNFGGRSDFSVDSHDLPHIWTGVRGKGGRDWPYLEAGFPVYDCPGWIRGGDEVWATAVVPAEYGWMEWDVTALVRQWNTGALPNHGLVIRDAEEQWHSPGLYPEASRFGVWFHSREHMSPTGEDYRPCLVVTYDLGCPSDFDAIADPNEADDGGKDTTP